MTEELSQGLREALTAGWEAADQPATPEPAPEPAAPVRDEAGRFAAKEAEPEAPAAPEEPDDYDEAVGLDRETWKLTPAQARERAKALAREAKEAAERAKEYEPLARVVGPRRDALRATWGDEGRAVEQLFHLSDWAERDFAGFVKHLASQRGIDLRALVPQQQDAGQQQPQTYEQLVAQAREEARRAAQEEFQARETQRALADFDRNEAFEFRHDPEVRKVMGGLLASGAAADLPTAYSMATKAHPTIAAKLAERESAERAKREAEERARRDREKASAAVSVRGAPGTARPPAAAAPASIRDSLMAGWDAASGRV